MANFQSIQEANRTSISNQGPYPEVMNASTDINSRSLTVIGEYTSVGTETTGDTIDMFTIPAGVRPVELVLIYSAWGGALTLSIGAKDLATGSNSSAAFYLAATSVVSAGQTIAMSTLALNILVAPTVDRKVFLTLGGGTASATSIVKAWCQFAALA